MSEHAWVFENLTSYSTGGLEPAERERIEQHAAGCATCTRALAELRALDERVENLFAPVRPAAGFENRVLQKLRPHLQRRRFGLALRWAAAAAAVLFLGVVGAAMHALARGGQLPFPGLAQAPSPDARMLVGLSRADGRSANQGREERDGIESVDSSASFAAKADINESVALKRFHDIGAEFQETSRPENGKKQDLNFESAGWGRSLKRVGAGEVAVTDEEGKNQAKYLSDLSARGFAPRAGAEAGFGMTLGDKARDTPAAKEPASAAGRGEGAWGYAGDGRGPARPAGEAAYFRTEQSRPTDYFHPPADKAPADGAAPAPAGITPSSPAPARADDTALGARPAESAQPKGEKTPPPPAELGRKIIRTGEIEFEIDSFDSTVEAINKLVSATQGAFVATVNSDKLANGKVRGSMVVRMPPERLDGFLLALRKELGKTGELKSQRIGSQDVTKQYTDIESRLKAARTMEERLLNIIKTGKGEIKDLVAAERELGVWRTKIEEMEGEIRYYNNQIGLSTLTITLQEKSIQSPTALVTTEKVNMRIEVDDVEKAQKDALAAVSQHKGRVAKSELKQHPAGQLEAVLVFEVSPDAAAEVRKELNKLGTVTTQDSERTQQAEGGTGRPDDVKVRTKDVQFNVTLYNVANIQPREAFHLQVASNDVPGSFRKLKDAVTAAEGQIRTAQLNEQDKLNVSADLHFDVPRKHQQTIEKLLAQLGEVFSRSTSQAAVGETATDKKVGYRLKLLSVASIPPRETVILKIEVADVRKTAAEFVNLVRDRKGLVKDDQFTREAREGDIEILVVYVPFSSKDEVMQKFSSAGNIRRERIVPNPEVPEGTLAVARFSITLLSAGPIVPGEEALWPKIRTSLFYSFTALAWSLAFIILGVCVVLPWALIIYAVYRIVRRMRGKAQAAGTVG